MISSLDVTRRYIIENGKSSNISHRVFLPNILGLSPDDNCEFNLVIKLFRKAGYPDLPIRPDDRRGGLQETGRMLVVKLSPLTRPPFRRLPTGKLRKMRSKVHGGMNNLAWPGNGTQQLQLLAPPDHAGAVLAKKGFRFDAR